MFNFSNDWYLEMASYTAQTTPGQSGSPIINKNNPIAEVRFQDLYPVNISALEFNQNATDVEYLTVSAEFVYKIYEIHSL